MLSKLDELTIALTKLHTMGFTDDGFLDILDKFGGSLRISLCRMIQKDEIDFLSKDLRRICFFLLKISSGELSPEVHPIIKRLTDKERKNLFMDLLIDSESSQSFALKMLTNYKMKDCVIEVFKLWVISSEKIKKEIIQSLKSLQVKGAEIFLANKLKSETSVIIQNDILTYFLSPSLKSRKNVFTPFLVSQNENQRTIALRGIINYGSYREKMRLRKRIHFEKSPEVGSSCSFRFSNNVSWRKLSRHSHSEI